MSIPVLALAGAGEMATATAVRFAGTHTVVVGDPSPRASGETVAAVEAAGGSATAVSLDVTDAEQVAAFARACADAGPVTALLVAAGLSPAQGVPEHIVEVDLLGTIRVLDAFRETLAEGGAAVVIASIAGQLLGHVDIATASAWAHLDVDELRRHEDLTADALFGNPALAYMRAKHAVHLRVRAAARPWGARGLRINSVSPGVVDTAMGREELAGSNGPGMQLLVDLSPIPRLATADEIAAAAAFLLGPESSFITGTDLVVDGGSVATALVPPPPTDPEKNPKETP